MITEREKPLGFNFNRDEWSGLRLLLLIMSGLLSVGATAQNSTQPNEDKSRIMGVRVSVDLFDQKTCEDSILPAYRKFIETSKTDLLAHRLHDAIAQLALIPSDHQITFRDRSGYEGDIAVLEGKTYYSSEGREPTEKDNVTPPADMRFFVQNFVGPSLIEIFCLPHDLAMNPRQNMSGDKLMGYLYSKSRWIEDYFTFSKEVSGPIPEIKLGEWSRFFSEEEVRAFDLELSKMDKPQDRELRADFDNLYTIVHLAAVDSKFRLLISVF